MRIWETVYDSLVGTDVLGGPIRKRLGQVKNITLVEQTPCKPIADPALRALLLAQFHGFAAKYSTRKSSTRSLCDLAQDDT